MSGNVTDVENLKEKLNSVTDSSSLNEQNLEAHNAANTDFTNNNTAENGDEQNADERKSTSSHSSLSSVISEIIGDLVEYVDHAAHDPQKIDNRKWAIHRFNEVLLSLFFIGFAQAIGHPEILRIIMLALVATEVSVLAINLRKSYWIPGIAPRGERPHEILINDMRAQTVFSFIFTLGVAAVVILGGELGMSAVESLGPVIFTALCTTGIAFRLGMRAYYQNQLAKLATVEFISEKERTDRTAIYSDLIYQNTVGAVLSTTLGAGVVGSLFKAFPYSSPYYGLAAGGIIGSYSAATVIAPLIQRCFPKPASSRQSSEDHIDEIEEVNDLENNLGTQAQQTITVTNPLTKDILQNTGAANDQRQENNTEEQKHDIETGSVMSDTSSTPSWQNKSDNVRLGNVISSTLHGKNTSSANQQKLAKNKKNATEEKASCRIM